MRRLLLHPWLTSRARFVLAAVLVAAAWPKLIDPPTFAHAVWNYALLPGWAVVPAALALPWLELFCGLALFLGVWVRAAAAWCATLMLAFCAALSLNLARHHPVDCGCFGPPAAARTQAQQLTAMGWDIVRDLALLLLAVQVLAAAGKPGRD